MSSMMPPPDARPPYVHPAVAPYAHPAAPPTAPPSVPMFPAEPQPYHHLWRTPRHRWWKPLVVIGVMIAAYFVLTLATTVVAVIFDAAQGRTGVLTGDLVMTPALFLATNLGLGLMIPVSMLIGWAMYGQRPRWMSSVTGGIRWGLMARCALVLVPIYLLYIGGSTLLSGGLPRGPVNPDAVVYVVLIVLTTPFQSAGEEYAVRGALTRAIAAWIPPRFVAFLVSGVVSGLVFTAGHPNLTPWRLVIFIVVALGFSVLVWRTGGLEAAILGHALNNVLALLPTAVWGDMGVALFGEAAEAVPVDALVILAVAVVSWGAIELVFRYSKYSRVSQVSAATGTPAG